MSIEELAEIYIRAVSAIDLLKPGYIDNSLINIQVGDTNRIIDDLNMIINKGIELQSCLKRGNLSRVENFIQDKSQISDEISYLRLNRLINHAKSAISYMKRFVINELEVDFDAECKEIYNLDLPRLYSEQELEQELEKIKKHFTKELETVDLHTAYNTFRDKFIVSPNKAHELFSFCLDEARNRTKQNIQFLLREEGVKFEFVENKPWSAYNWYLGNYKSLMQINLDKVLYIDDLLLLSAHEAYPGHHLQGILMEMAYRNLNWREFGIFLLNSPDSVIMEGAADASVDICFPDRIDFEVKYILPKINESLTREDLERYYSIRKILAETNIDVIIGRNFINKIWSREEYSKKHQVWTENSGTS